ncbi:MAG: bifunctional demethylmenaquinone methyltransferase/2-methoxy-6-polyprenyl-1,4-benzoquinol methylase UbiE [Cyclobacteriaceae bacterium]|nr:bifunctional demethylmenaquinone methyltransferase/2-methoxy-6-polyprenyl-1,4-benzoquinol methylase UbiE [Cyclobacteriaceae bacterium]
MQIVPYKNNKLSKKEQVAMMFDNISQHYDFLNHFLSLGIDIRWRKKAIRLLKDYRPKRILDIATGTGDFAIEALKLNPDQVTGIDISEGMLDKGREKLKRMSLENKISLMYGDSENLQFEDNKFDAIIVAFGVRNFQNLYQGLSEMSRVLNSGGAVVILEFSKPQKFPFKQVYEFYFKNILPFIGKKISKDQSAYTYLPESVQAFPERNDFLTLLEKAGFIKTKCLPLTFGISSVYLAEKA